MYLVLDRKKGVILCFDNLALDYNVSFNLLSTYCVANVVVKAGGLCCLTLAA